MKKRTLVGGSVVLELRDVGDLGAVKVGSLMTPRTEKEVRRDLEKLSNAAKTRLSKFDDELGAVRIQYEYEDVFSECGYVWTEESDTFNGGCCEADMESAPAPEEAKGEKE